ncbi:hypothetical protein FVE85_4504 [Porphyridium purpureum]|uniref:Uncharacterized protein n=1 Tax=Porphyridium purpureum TaxID=35688 RepID=A0A5J4YKU0_PORPP|nr:hypothetical protein FVE85_4504 [Porphyridium purpureum]|eukprot:POR0511..scf297_16
MERRRGRPRSRQDKACGALVHTQVGEQVYVLLVRQTWTRSGFERLFRIMTGAEALVCSKALRRRALHVARSRSRVTLGSLSSSAGTKPGGEMVSGSLTSLSHSNSLPGSRDDYELDTDSSSSSEHADGAERTSYATSSYLRPDGMWMRCSPIVSEEPYSSMDEELEGVSSFFRSEDDLTSTLHNCLTDELEIFCSSFEAVWNHPDVPASWKACIKETAETMYDDVLCHEARLELIHRKTSILDPQDVLARNRRSIPRFTVDGREREPALCVLQHVRRLVGASLSDDSHVRLVQSPHGDRLPAPWLHVLTRTSRYYVVRVDGCDLTPRHCADIYPGAKSYAWHSLASLSHMWFPRELRDMLKVVIPYIERSAQPLAVEEDVEQVFENEPQTWEEIVFPCP